MRKDSITRDVVVGKTFILNLERTNIKTSTNTHQTSKMPKALSILSIFQRRYGGVKRQV
ncbi:Hypothetical protein J6898_00681 [Nakaseomyces glabratus]